MKKNIITDCGTVKAPENGFVNYPNGTKYGSVATFECSIGYTLIGDDTHTCQANKSWSNDNPTCKMKGKRITIVRYKYCTI